MYDTQKLARWCSDQIFNATVVPDPFPHLIIDNIYPEEFYNAIVSNMLPRKEFDVYHAGTARKDETTFRLQPQKYALYSEQNDAIMNGIRSTFPLISELIAAKLSPFFPNIFKYIFPTDWHQRLSKLSLHHSLSMAFLDRVPQHSQCPHTDASYRIGSWLFYLPLDEKKLGSGTEIFRATNFHKNYNGLETYFSAKPLNIDTEKVKEIEFRPNRIVAFLNSPISLHGYRNTVDINAQPTRRITMNNWIEYERKSYIEIFKDVPKEYFDSHYDTIWKPE